MFPCSYVAARGAPRCAHNWTPHGPKVAQIHPKLPISGALAGSPRSLLKICLPCIVILCVLACAFGLQRTPTVLDRCRSYQPLASWLDATELLKIFVDASLLLRYCLQLWSQLLTPGRFLSLSGRGGRHFSRLAIAVTVCARLHIIAPTPLLAVVCACPCWARRTERF